MLLRDAVPGGLIFNVADVAEALGITTRSIEHLKKRFVDDGHGAAIDRGKRSHGKSCLTEHLRGD